MKRYTTVIMAFLIAACNDSCAGEMTATGPDSGQVLNDSSVLMDSSLEDATFEDTTPDLDASSWVEDFGTEMADSGMTMDSGNPWGTSRVDSGLDSGRRCRRGRCDRDDDVDEDTDEDTDEDHDEDVDEHRDHDRCNED